MQGIRSDLYSKTRSTLHPDLSLQSTFPREISQTIEGHGPCPEARSNPSVELHTSSRGVGRSNYSFFHSDLTIRSFRYARDKAVSQERYIFTTNHTNSTAIVEKGNTPHVVLFSQSHNNPRRYYSRTSHHGLSIYLPSIRPCEPLHRKTLSCFHHLGLAGPQGVTCVGSHPVQGPKY